MAVNYGQGYNIYDNIRRKVRAKKSAGYVYGRPPSDTTPGQGPISDVVPDVPSETAPPSITQPATQITGMPSAPAFAGDKLFGTVDGVATAMDITESTTGLEFGDNRLTAAEYGAQNVTGTFGLSSIAAKEGAAGTLGSILENAVAVVDPSPFGVLTGLMGGTLRQDPYGKTTAIPGGLLGLVGEMSLEKQYEVAGKIKAGVPGHHQFYMANQLVSIVPQTVMGYDVGFTALGTFNGAPQDAINAYAGMLGYDPRSVNLMTNPRNDPVGFGKQLEGFISTVGGFAEDGSYFTASGVETSLSMPQIETHFGLTNAVSGLAYSLDAVAKSGLSPEVQTTIADGLRSGSLMATPVIGPSGENLGYETPTGGVVRDRDGDPVMSGPPGNQTPVTSGTGLYQPSDDSPNKGLDYDPNLGFDEGDTGDTGGVDQATADEQGGVSGFSPFAEGGIVPPDQVPAGEAPVAAEAGFVGTEPENVPEVETVKDDVPVEVPEGTFVLNAAAVEFMGSADVKKMILEAMEEAEKQGVDIKQENAKIPKEDLVSLVVSKGEVIIPPQLAEIIGYDRLNKINNRGKAEVEKRSDEAEQQTQEPQKPAVLRGGMLDGGRARSRRRSREESQEERELRQLGEIADDLFGKYKRIADRPKSTRDDSTIIDLVAQALEKIRKGKDANVVSKTLVDAGSTQRQRDVTGVTFGDLSPANAQLLYMEMPTLYNIISESDDPQALEALQRMEQQLKDQIGDNVPEQNAPREIENTTISESFKQMMAELDKPKQRTVSETPVGGEQGFISRSY